MQYTKEWIHDLPSSSDDPRTPCLLPKIYDPLRRLRNAQKTRAPVNEEAGMHTVVGRRHTLQRNINDQNIHCMLLYSVAKGSQCAKTAHGYKNVGSRPP